MFFFPEENTVGHAPKSNIVYGVIEEGNQVRIKWDNEEVPAKVLRLTGTFLKSWHYKKISNPAHYDY